MDALLIPANGLTRVLTPADLAAAKAANRPALIGTIEGCHFLEGKLERVEEVYRRGIRQLQIVQRALDALEARFVAERVLTPEEERGIVAAIHDALGHPFQVTLQPMSEIPRPASMKFEDFKCELPD